MMKKEYWIWFASINILPIKKYRLLEKFKGVEKIYNASQSELLKIEDLNFLDIAEIEKSKNKDLIKKYEEYINKNDIKVININDKHYPDKLKNIYDPPVVVFAKGRVELLSKNSVGIVGSRDANEYGKKVSYEISYNLAKNNLVVISGLAKGIDSMAHLRSIKCKR